MASLTDDQTELTSNLGQRNQMSHVNVHTEDTEAAKHLTVSLVIPVYNEASHLNDFLKLIDALETPFEKELVIVDDCSKDTSWEILTAYNFRSRVQLLKQELNQGKGAAIRRGIAEAKGVIIGIQDADFEYDPKDIPSILEPFQKGRADVVFGSRYKGSRQVHRTYHYLVNRILTMLSNFSSGLYLSDMETCYKFFRADIIQNIVLTSDRFGFEPEITAKVARLKIRVMEVPISYFPRNYLEGKKINWKDGVAAIWHIFNFNFRTNWSKAFRPTLPERYVPQGGNWL